MKHRLDERGQVLWEMMVSLPVIMLLLTSLGGGFLWLMGCYTKEMADLELTNEMRMSMAQVTDDMRYAKSISSAPIDGNYDQLTITLPDNTKVIYWVARYNLSWRLVRNSNNMPLTGESSLGKTDVVTFHCRNDSGYTDVWQIELAAASRLTGHKFSLRTAVYVGTEGTADG